MRYSLVLLLLIFFKSTTAQDWVHKGSTWKYIYEYRSNVDGSIASYGTVVFKYVNDTVVGGINCKKIVYKTDAYDGATNQYDSLESNGYESQIVYTYTDNNKVFFSLIDYPPYTSDSSFSPFYDFDINVGDSIKDPFLVGSSGCQQQYYKVFSKGTKLINGKPLQYFSVQGVSYYFFQFNIIERIGGEGFFHSNFMQCRIREYENFRLVSYQDDSFDVYYTGLRPINCSDTFSTAYDTVHNNFTLFTKPFPATFVDRFHWDFGDGTTSTLESPSHTYTSDGLYNVCRKIYTISGDSCEYCHVIGKDALGNIVRNSGFTLNTIKQNVTTDLPKVYLNRQDLKITPNPTVSQLTIEGLPINAPIEIYNLLGETVYKGTTNSIVHSIDISSLPNGMYFLNKTKIIKE